MNEPVPWTHHDRHRLADGSTLLHHPRYVCHGTCGLHGTASDHHMVDWPFAWHQGRYMLSRVCPHGLEHPDPDAVNFQLSQGDIPRMAHECDGCCTPGPVWYG